MTNRGPILVERRDSASETRDNVGRAIRPLRILNVACVRWWSALAHYAHTAGLDLQMRGHGVLCAGTGGSPYLEQCRVSGLRVADEIDPTGGGLGPWLRSIRSVRKLLRSGS